MGFIRMGFSITPNKTVPFGIRHADADVLVVEKPSGVVTQPGKKHEHDSLLNGLFCEYGNRLQNLGAARDWGLLHRLDKDTSGLVLVALSTAAHGTLSEQFKRRQVQKTYWAIVLGCPKVAQGVIQKPIVEVVGKTKRAIIKHGGKPAITAYRVLQRGEQVSLIEARPKTGRLHQIRVHLAALGHPILGEPTYAGRAQMPTVPRLCLHAAVLSFVHPATTRRVEMQSPWPQDLRKTLRRLGLVPPDAGPPPG
jgi:23S rRNA pseudouridine1911/1915/1917 synthase